MSVRSFGTINELMRAINSCGTPLVVNVSPDVSPASAIDCAAATSGVKAQVLLRPVDCVAHGVTGGGELGADDIRVGVQDRLHAPKHG